MNESQIQQRIKVLKIFDKAFTSLKDIEPHVTVKRFVSFICPTCDDYAALGQFSYDSWYEEVPVKGDATRCYRCGQQTIREESDHRPF